MESSTNIPLAERLRPKKLTEVVGQDDLIKSGGLLNVLSKSDRPSNLIFWGPPGSGKTTIARILIDTWGCEAVELSAVNSGLKEIRTVISVAESNHRLGQSTVLFIDEIHRFNKKQQDIFLPYIESGVLNLVGATTENPSFTVNNALLSRCQVVVIEALGEKDLMKIVRRSSKALGVSFSPAAAKLAIRLTGGDGRALINALETSARLVKRGQKVDAETLKKALQRSNYQFDKDGENHYNLASAFIKSMRGSDDVAALYYMHRLLAGGEDPNFIARRMVIFASEDIGMAAPYALTLAVSAQQAVERVGLPECEYNLSHAAVAMARSPKSREVADMMFTAKAQVDSSPNQPVPVHLRNASTGLMKDLGYGKDYKWESGFRPEKGLLPDNLK